jgi:predicted dehydrogenase
MKKIRVAILGTGFMGKVHAEAIRRVGNVEIVAIAGISIEDAKSLADPFGIEWATSDYHELLASPDIDAVHICTPNSLHCEMATAALKAGKHVLCEKPLASSYAEAASMVALAEETGLANCVNYNNRSYPQVRNLLAMREAGELGEIQIVQGTYSQDWLLYDTDYNWRVESGPSRAFADIGTHWCDLTEFVTGLRITSVCAALETFHKTRKKPRGYVETFAGKNLQPEDYDEVPVSTEDFCSMMFRMGERATGSMTVSQVSAGRKNHLRLEIYGTKAGAEWNSERPDELWIGKRSSANEVYIKDPSLMKPQTRRFADLPGGHSEGFDDSFKQNFRSFYRTVADRAHAVEYPVFKDGLRQLRLQDAVLDSSAKRAWVEVAG